MVTHRSPVKPGPRSSDDSATRVELAARFGMGPGRSALDHRRHLGHVDEPTESLGIRPCDRHLDTVRLVSFAVDGRLAGLLLAAGLAADQSHPTPGTANRGGPPLFLPL